MYLEEIVNFEINERIEGDKSSSGKCNQTSISLRLLEMDGWCCLWSIGVGPRKKSLEMMDLLGHGEGCMHAQLSSHSFSRQSPKNSHTLPWIKRTSPVARKESIHNALMVVGVGLSSLTPSINKARIFIIFSVLASKPLDPPTLANPAHLSEAKEKETCRLPSYIRMCCFLYLSMLNTMQWTWSSQQFGMSILLLRLLVLLLLFLLKKPPLFWHIIYRGYKLLLE